MFLVGQGRGKLVPNRLLAMLAVTLGVNQTEVVASNVDQQVVVQRANLAAVQADSGESTPTATCVALVSPCDGSIGSGSAPKPGVGPMTIIYLEFDGAVVNLDGTAYAALNDDITVTVPPFEHSLAIIYPELDPTVARDEIVAQVSLEYAPFHVLVTDDLTTAELNGEGSYERLYVGGSRSIFSNPGGAITNATLGIAAPDPANSDPNSIGFVLVEHFGEYLSDTSVAIPLIGAVASHEAGHEIGLEHIANVKSRMYYRTTVDADEIAETWLAGVVQGSNPLRYQDTNLLLAQTLGLGNAPFGPAPARDDLGDNYFAATPIADPTTGMSVLVDGTVETLGDVDVAYFTASRSRRIAVTVTPNGDLNVVLAVVDLDGNVIAVQNAGGRGIQEVLNLSTSAGQSYFVYVNGGDLGPGTGGGLSRGSYQLAIAEENPTQSVIHSLAADVDADGDVDLSDFLSFQQCFTTANQRAEPHCESSDFDGDQDVDLADFLVFQAVFTGSR